jgi:hypothetical protein
MATVLYGTQLGYALLSFASGAGAISLAPATLTVSLVAQAPTVTYTPALTARLQLLVSGVLVANAIGLRPLTVSALWSVSGGATPYTYQWLFQLPTGSATTSTVTRHVSAAGGDLRTVVVSVLVSDAGAAQVTSRFLVALRCVHTPNYFDGRVQPENQYRRRVWPT